MASHNAGPGLHASGGVDPQKMSAPPSYFEAQGQGAYPQQSYAPPPMGFVGATSTTVITSQPQLTATHVIIQPALGGHNSQRMTCPYCRADISTAVTFEPGALTHVAALLLCLFGCWLGCCLIPYCIDGCQDATHKCPNCGHHVGTTKPM